MLVDLFQLYHSFAHPVCFDNDGAADDSQSDDGGEGSASGGGEGDGEGRTFTQDELNKILAEDKRRHRAQYEKIEKSYQELLKKTNLTQDERNKLEESLEDVRKQLRSKEEQAKYEKRELEDKYQKQIAELESRAKGAETKFVDMLITRAIQDAAVSGDAFNPSQVVQLLKPFVKLVDEKPMIDFPDVSSETGESIVTQMTPDEAIKRMKQIPETWGNLFKSNIVSGIGGASNTGANPGADGRVDPRKLTPEQYMKLRKENPKALGL